VVSGQLHAPDILTPLERAPSPVHIRWAGPRAGMEYFGNLRLPLHRCLWSELRTARECVPYCGLSPRAVKMSSAVGTEIIQIFCYSKTGILTTTVQRREVEANAWVQWSTSCNLLIIQGYRDLQCNGIWVTQWMRCVTQRTFTYCISIPFYWLTR
jgi:hypothetical protein